jgi:hypothetical protein
MRRGRKQEAGRPMGPKLRTKKNMFFFSNFSKLFSNGI